MAQFLSDQLSTRESRHETTVLGTRIGYWVYEPVPPTPTQDARPQAVAPPTRTIVIIHGFRGDHHGLLRLVDALPGYRFICPDLPGFGASAAFAQRPHELDSYADFVDAFITELSLGPAAGEDPETILLGHSFGSLVCSRFMLRHPGRVHPLILINPIAAPALEGPKAVLTQAAVLYYKAAAALSERPGRALLANPAIVRIMSLAMTRTKEPALRRFIHAQHRAYFSDFASRASLLEAFEASVSATVTEAAGQLNVPTLLIVGSSDEVAPLPAQQVLHESLADSELVVIDGVGHLIHYETPGPAAAAISDFLDRHPGADRLKSSEAGKEPTA